MDSALQYLIQEASKTTWVQKLVLFGSRARGDHEERSDYDVAVVTTNNDTWSKWSLEIKENAPTLCGMDLIKLDNTTSEELRTVIEREGKVIYEQ